MKKLDTIELDFTILEFYPNFVVSRIKEDVLFSKLQVRELIEVCSGFYSEVDFVYISHRVNDYNVDPTIYHKIEKINNLAGIAIVSVKAASLKMAEFEQKFSKVPFEVFTELEEAQNWVKELIKK